MHIERVKLTARKSLPNYEHVIAEVEFHFAEADDHLQFRYQMQSTLSDCLDLAESGVHGTMTEPAPVVRKSAVLPKTTGGIDLDELERAVGPAAKPLAPAVQKVVATVRPTAPVVRETAPVVRQTAPVVAKAPASASPGTAPTPEQMTRRVALITAELTNAELSTAMFLTHHGIHEIIQHPLLQRPLVSARELKELVEALKHDAT